MNRQTRWIWIGSLMLFALGSWMIVVKVNDDRPFGLQFRERPVRLKDGVPVFILENPRRLDVFVGNVTVFEEKPGHEKTESWGYQAVRPDVSGLNDVEVQVDKSWGGCCMGLPEKPAALQVRITYQYKLRFCGVAWVSSARCVESPWGLVE